MNTVLTFLGLWLGAVFTSKISIILVVYYGVMGWVLLRSMTPRLEGWQQEPLSVWKSIGLLMFCGPIVWALFCFFGLWEISAPFRMRWTWISMEGHNCLVCHKGYYREFDNRVTDVMEDLRTGVFRCSACGDAQPWRMRLYRFRKLAYSQPAPADQRKEIFE